MAAEDHMAPSGPAPSQHPMRPLRPLYLGLFAAQAAGAIAGLWAAPFPSWFENLWAGAALATLPGFFAGWLAQRRFAPEVLAAQRGTVRRIGFSAALLTLAVFFMPFGA